MLPECSTFRFDNVFGVPFDLYVSDRSGLSDRGQSDNKHRDRRGRVLGSADYDHWEANGMDSRLHAFLCDLHFHTGDVADTLLLFRAYRKAEEQHSRKRNGYLITVKKQRFRVIICTLII